MAKQILCFVLVSWKKRRDGWKTSSMYRMNKVDSEFPLVMEILYAWTKKFNTLLVVWRGCSYTCHSQKLLPFSSLLVTVGLAQPILPHLLLESQKKSLISVSSYHESPSCRPLFVSNYWTEISLWLWFLTQKKRFELNCTNWFLFTPCVVFFQCFLLHFSASSALSSFSATWTAVLASGLDDQGAISFDFFLGISEIS